MIRLLAPALVLLLLAACSGGEEAKAPAEPQDPDRSASCEVCGMTVVDYPGPKAQIWLQGEDAPLHFCSTRDFFAYLLEPDSPQPHRMRAMFVHDMGATDWEDPQPGSASWIPAKEAFYVVGSDRKGSMGPTLASFAERAAAASFRDQHGGRILRSPAINRSLVVDLPTGPNRGPGRTGP